MVNVSILKINDNIIVPIQEELHDLMAKKMQELILQSIEKNNARGLLIDISAVRIVDSFLGRLLGETAKMAELMGARTVLVGMKKEVVLTLIQLGLEIKNLQTALNIEDGLALLEKLKQESNNYEKEITS